MAPNDSPRFRISLTQLVASALAAVTAAIAGSYLGVNGTVIGAAIVSVLSVAGTAFYSHSLERTNHHVRAALPHPLARAGTAAVIVFAAALAVVTGVELAAGRPVSDLVSGKQATGTTVFGSQLKTTTGASTAPVPAVTVTVTPNVVVTTPTVTQTAPAVTVTSTPTVTPSTSAATSASGTPTDTPVP